MPVPTAVRVRSALLLAMLASTCATAPAWAQVARLEGASLEGFRGEYRLNALNYRRTELSTGRFGTDIALGFVPEQLRARTLLLDLDLGIAYEVPVDQAKLFLKGGVAGFFGLGDGHALYPGLQAGVAAALPLQRRCYMRLDLSRRIYFARGEESFRLWSVGIGLSAGLPR